MDDEFARQSAELDPVGLIAPPRPLVIDEIQRTPKLILPIKASVDRERTPGQFFLTGSADLLRIPEPGDSLAGRAATCRLHPFSQGEIAGTDDRLVDALVSGLASGTLTSFTTTTTREDISQRVLRGGYPAAFGLPADLRFDWFENYVDRLLRRDSGDLGRYDTAALARLARLLAAAPGAELVRTRLASGLEISANSIDRYLSALDALFLATTLPAWSKNLTKRQIGRPRVHLSDSGLATHLGGLGEERLLQPESAPLMGPLLEAFVVNELVRQLGWSRTRYRLSHYRDGNGREIDVMIDLPDGGVIGLEIKYAARPTRAHFQHLLAMEEAVGDDWRMGVLLYAGDRAERLTATQWAFPVSALWELAPPS